MITNYRILVIDDDPDIREIYHRILSSIQLNEYASDKNPLINGLNGEAESSNNPGFDLTMVENGEEGINAVKESMKNNEPYTAAFVDMMMPGLNGAETTAWLWEIDPNIKIVIVTAHSQYMTKDVTMVAGREDLFYLKKPFTKDEICQFAIAFTKQWQLEREKERLTEDLRIAREKLENINKDLNKKVEEQTTMLIQSDKMASIGLLAAGVAHEINNPISFINCNLASMKSYTQNIISLLKRYQQLDNIIQEGETEKIVTLRAEIQNFWKNQKMDFILEDITELIKDSLDGTERVSKIVHDLKSFARVNEEDIESVDLNDVIDASLNILKNELKYQVKIIKEYDNLPKVKCFVQKMSQVFMNLITNASQAIEGKGTIRIGTKHQKGSGNPEAEYIELRISDNGGGIPKENLTKIFDPFFTTKPVGVGTGLGLKITYDIIQAHGGKIMVESEVGKGTTFIIKVPLETNIEA